MKIDEGLTLIKLEAEKASTCSEHFASYHEGYAVLLEEINELWDEIKKNPQNPNRVTDEAIHVAAMALRILVDLC